MKKNILFAIVLSCVSFIMKAQQVEGLWSFYPTKSSTAGIIYESIGDEVFYISGSNLFSYEKESGDITSYNSGNYLSDNTIKNIYYNYNGGYLLVVYENSNIDFIYPNRRVVNVPDLMNRVTMSSKVINDVAFADNRVYMATDFGLIIIDDTSHDIYKSYIYNSAITKIAATANSVIALTNNKLYIADANSNLMNFSTAWRAVDVGALSPTTVHHLYAINDNAVFVVFDSSSYIYNIEEQSFTAQPAGMASVKLISAAKDGLFFSYNDKVEFVSSELTDANLLNIDMTLTLSNSSVKNGYYSSYNDEGTIWACSSSGISHFSIQGESFTWLVNPVAYNSSSVEIPQCLQVHNNKVYVKNMAPYHFSVDMSTATVISVLDLNTREWSNLSLDKVVRGGNKNSLGVLRSSYNLAFDPDSSDVMYLGSWFDGLHKFAGSKYVGNYNQTNSPLVVPWAMIDSFTGFDSKGNLWTIMVSNSLTDKTILGCLPADKKVLDPGVCKFEDWKTYHTGSATEFFNYLAVCKKSPHVIFVHGKQVSRNRISVLNSETEEMRTFTSFTTQEGNNFGSAVHYFYTATEDNNGDVWIGTSEGVIVLPDIENYMNEDYSCIQVKCFNEGTGQDEYLLADNHITVIAVDSCNRKWIGTNEDGLYLVNEDGSRILGHYTPDNSLLPSPVVYGLDVNKATNEVFVATAKGVASFMPQTGSVSITSYDDVVVLPNPVLPDYKGWITIQGLVDNSVVKITDVEGNIYSQGISAGNTYKWDGRTSAGERVMTGTYLVYASHDGGEAQVVAKIMVVN